MARFHFVLISVLTAALAGHGAAAATITVDTTNEGVTSGHCSLQEAMYSAEFGTNIALNSAFPMQPYGTACAPGSGSGDTIVLQAGATYSFTKSWVDLYNYMGPTATPIIFKPMTIEGNGATLQWTGSGNSRLFAVGSLPSTGPQALVIDGNTYSGGGDLTLKDVYVKGFLVHGGNGASGGGGGLGAGGAIFVDHTGLTVENSTFDGNGAVGGNGSAYMSTGGGGGGLAGNGGVGDSQDAAGGGGGGTLLDGTSSNVKDIGGNGGAACGGQGGDGGFTSNDGRSAPCKGGGGGGGGGDNNQTVFGYGGGGNGNFGGGGGGSFDDGGTGGFGGGGGGSGSNGDGGNGGFGGGGGAGDFDFITGTPGKGGGSFGEGNADEFHGGGGNALGGAVFSYFGTVLIENSTFVNNFVDRGVSGGGSADNGGDAGGAIFAVDGTLKVLYSTIVSNQATGSRGGVAFYTWDDGFCGGDNGCISFTNYFLLVNTIIANNGPLECSIYGHPDDNLISSSAGSGNLIMQNDTGGGACKGVVSTSDPSLQTMRLNDPGNTPTFALLKSSPAADVGVSSSPDADTPLPTTDQRGVSRPQPDGGSNDIGAYEARLPDFTFSTVPNTSLDIGGSGSVSVTVNSFEYFNGDVSLSVPSSSSGLTASITDPLIAVPTNSSGISGLNFQLAPTVTPGSYTATVEGDATGWNQSKLTHTTTATVLVSATIGGMAKVISSFTASGDINVSGITTALDSKLNAALNFIDSGDNQTAINVLDAFTYQVQAQSGKHITTAAANALITDAQAVMNTVGAGLRPNPLMGTVVNSSGIGVATTVSLFDSSKHLIATATSDSTGFYYFPLTKLLTPGVQYTLQVSVPRGYKKSNPASQTLTWSGSLIMVTPFLLN